MKLIQKTSDKIIFSEKINYSLANAIRRFVNEIPTLAIDEVEIIRNDSALYDETLAHRIALVPLKQIKSKKEAVLKLQVKKEGTIHSSEIKGELEPVYPNIPLVILNKGQEIEMICYARLGKGKEHAKFSPGVIFYREEVEMKDARGEKIDEKYIAKQGEIDRYKTDLVDEYAESKEKGNIKIIPRGDLIIEVESFGQLKPEEIFTKSVEALRDNLQEVVKDLK